ncbi:MAG: mismatch repair endonuclease [Mucilaginibacter sp.]|nr:mismatch repair endonuclease [Mucilaginibacter sp.]
MSKSKKIFLRDGRAPIPLKESTSKVMSANKAKNTKPEIRLRKALWSAGLKGYRLNWKKIPGRPDIVFVSKKVAIFVNGCFWHRCEKCSPNFPKTNIEFWSKKFSTNIERDKNKITQLELLGWKVYTIWECDIQHKLLTIVNMLASKLL